MAILKTGYLSPFKNKLGNGVGRRWRNLNVIAEYNGTPRNPRTTEQRKQRAVFSVLSNLSRAFKSTLGDSLGGICEGTKTFPRAKFISLNHGVATAATPDSVNVVYGDIVVARGGVPPASFGAPQFDTPQTVEVGFGTNAFKAAYPNANPADLKCRLVVFCIDAELAVFGDTAGDLNTASVLVPNYWNGMKVHVYGYLRYVGDDMPEYGLKKGDVSDSIYIGTGNIG